MESRTLPYRSLCAQYYHLDKPFAPADSLDFYLQHAKKAKGPVLEPMCGTGSFLIPFLQDGVDISGFDSSKYMLDILQQKSQAQGIATADRVALADFATFEPRGPYGLIFIPSGSIGLLIEQEEMNYALSVVNNNLDNKGKFIFEFEAPNKDNNFETENNCSWVDTPESTRIVLNTTSRFDPDTKVNSRSCKYELLQGDTVLRTEEEDFRVRLYEPQELTEILQKHGLQIANSTQHRPNTFECVKHR